MSDADHEIIRQRARGYKLAVNAPGVQDMLADLAGFCRAVRLVADKETLDPTRLAILVGRQQVWERIQHHFNLTTDELYALYLGRPFQSKEDQDNAA